MPAPARASRPFALCAATAISALLLAGEAAAAQTNELLQQALQSKLPHYDAAVREKFLADRAAAAEAAAQNPPTSATTTSGPRTSGRAGADVVELPKVTVHPGFDIIKPLPRPTAPKPLRDLKGEPFESGSARDERLIKKHIHPLVQAINPHGFLVTLARAAEKREQRVNEMSTLADALDFDAIVGRDPEQTGKLRREYLRLYYGGAAKALGDR